MMEFVMLTLSFTVAILLASVVSVIVILNTPVMKWYLKKVTKVTKHVMEDKDFEDLF